MPNSSSISAAQRQRRATTGSTPPIHVPPAATPSSPPKIRRRNSAPSSPSTLGVEAQLPAYFQQDLSAAKHASRSSIDHSFREPARHPSSRKKPLPATHIYASGYDRSLPRIPSEYSDQPPAAYSVETQESSSNAMPSAHRPAFEHTEQQSFTEKQWNAAAHMSGPVNVGRSASRTGYAHQSYTQSPYPSDNYNDVTHTTPYPSKTIGSMPNPHQKPQAATHSSSYVVHNAPRAPSTHQSSSTHRPLAATSDFSSYAPDSAPKPQPPSSRRPRLSGCVEATLGSAV
ncbi:hypothetical protein DXG03_005530 [Asterophora parasitica]|uniref:Uncharacterized protein n=1 Tax=Asterophora parasitica TaxID=117018 RepID=A0A9P7G7U7_9AGAR|nr:hypothetical protein DXG03_005530 [Asterophora parasitica]